jgi:hypothetical protein
MTVAVCPTEASADLLAFDEGRFPQAGMEWLNGPLQVTLRAYDEAVEAVRLAVDKAEWELRCDFLGLPRGTKVQYAVAPPYEKYLRRPDGSDVTDEGTIRRFCAEREPRYPRGALVVPVVPPKLPDCLTAYVRTAEGWWDRVDRAESSALSVPPDPIRVRHDAFFGEIFAALRAAGVEVSPREVSNQYYEDRNCAEPWYAFDVAWRRFTVGPRKRVISVTVEGESFHAGELRNLAERDGVSYWADESWKSGRTWPGKVTIHAWTKEKCVEYLLAAVRAVTCVAPSVRTVEEE